MSKLAAIATAMTVLAAIASPASAQTVEVHEEGGAHCGNVTVVDHAVSGGCTVHATTEPDTTANLIVHSMAGETHFSGCENEFEAHVGEDGLGFITDQELLPEAGSPVPCGLEACDEPTHERDEWPLLVWEGAPNIEDLATTFCLRTAESSGGVEGDAKSYCSIAFEMNQGVSPDHSQELTADEQACVDSPVEFSGHWVTDATEGEVVFEHSH
jgi:hypothetical protein